MMNEITLKKPLAGLRGTVLTGIAGALLLVGAFGTWSVVTELSGAIVTQGQVVVEGRNKVVQHRDGGIISEIAVANGSIVEKGQILVRLDPTELQTALNMARDRLAEQLALRARLKAEKIGASKIGVPNIDGRYGSEIRSRMDTELAAQQDILTARADVLANTRARLSETLARLDETERGFSERLVAMEEEIGFIDEEIEMMEPLFARKLVRRDQISQLQKARAKATGLLVGLRAEAAQIHISRRDAALKAEQIQKSFREGVVTELQTAMAEVKILWSEIETLAGRLDRVVVRAPYSGVVHELHITTVGGVVTPGATLLEIVPQDRATGIELQIAPDAIDDLHVGQNAELVLSAVDPQNSPRLYARVRTISAAAIPDPQTGADFYRVELEIDRGAFMSLGVDPIPGMPVEVYLATGERTVMSYLTEPLTSQFRRAFRE